MTLLATLAWEGAMVTHTGHIRAGNEDVVSYMFPRRSNPAARLDLFALVADGMGGHAAGEIASALAADAVTDAVMTSAEPLPGALRSALQRANEIILQQARLDDGLAGMGTTCTAVAIADGELYMGHIGDSRAYVIRGGRAYQVSEDHSLVAQMVRDGLLTPDEARNSPDRNIVTQVLGGRSDIDPQVPDGPMPMRLGDIVVLCSDGLSDLVDLEAIAELVAGVPPAEGCERLLQAALDAGGHDNISAGVFALTVPQRPAGVRATGVMTLADDAEGTA